MKKAKAVCEIKICVANLIKVSGSFCYLYTTPACLSGFPRAVRRLEAANWKWDTEKLITEKVTAVRKWGARNGDIKKVQLSGTI